MMQNELEQKLIDEFPTLFGQIHIKGSILFHRRIECWDGWYKIIRNLCKKIVEAEMDDFVEFCQIKQKFSVLCIHPDPKHKDIKIPEEFWSLLNEAVNESKTTCEVCGRPGTRREGGYILTLCDEHQKHREDNVRFWLDYEENPLKQEIRERMLSED